MLPFKKQPTARTVIIDRIGALVSGQLLVRDTWQPVDNTHSIRHAISNSVVSSSDSLDDTLRNYAQLTATKKPLHTINFTAASAVSGNVWHHGEAYDISVKGMPEHIIDHCDLTENERESLLVTFHAMSAKGDYVIALATGRLDRDISSLSELGLNEKLQFVGFVCLRVDVATSTRSLIRNATSRGTHIVIITGQYPAIGLHLGKQLGLARTASDVADARQLSMEGDSTILDTLRETSVITRADSAQKQNFMQLFESIDSSTKHVSNLEELQRALN